MYVHVRIYVLVSHCVSSYNITVVSFKSRRHIYHFYYLLNMKTILKVYIVIIYIYISNVFIINFFLLRIF